jgi:hypothetical protein
MAQWLKEKVETNQIPCSKLHNTNLITIIITAHDKGLPVPSPSVSTNQTSVLKKKATTLLTTAISRRLKGNFSHCHTEQCGQDRHQPIPSRIFQATLLERWGHMRIG